MFPTKINLLSKKSKSEQMLEGQHLFDLGKCTVTKNKTTSIHTIFDFSRPQALKIYKANQAVSLSRKKNK